MHAEEDDLDLRVGLPDLTGGLDPVEQRHGHVGDDQIGLELLGGFHHGASIRHYAYDLEIMLQDTTQAFGDDRMVIGQQHGSALHDALRRKGTRTLTRVPFPGLDRMDNVPFTNLTRSSMLTSPRPFFPLIVSRSNPSPRSSIANAISLALPVKATRTPAARPCLPMFRRLS